MGFHVINRLSRELNSQGKGKGLADGQRRSVPAARSTTNVLRLTTREIRPVLDPEISARIIW